MRRTRARRRRRFAGFTLLELMIASGMALGILAAATTAVLMLIRTMNRTGQSSAMVSEVQLLSEYLVAQVQGTAGGAVRPWMVTVVTNNGGEDGSDLFSFGDIPATLPASTTIIRHLEAGTYSLFLPLPTRANPRRGRCGLADLRKDTDNDGFAQDIADTSAAFRAADFKDQQVILTSPSGSTWRSVKLVEVGLANTSDGCFVRFEGGATGLTANGAFAAADRIDRTRSGAEDLEQWVGGQIAFVRAREWRYEKARPGLPGRLIERLTEGDRREERVLFEGVLDLQVALGYDFDPFDGTLSETPDSRDDEWLNASSTDSHNIKDIPAQLASSDIAVEFLRMIDVAVVIALPRAERTVSVTAFDGPARSGPEARVAGGRAYLRNLLLFL